MGEKAEDWRLQGQEKYLYGATVWFKKYADRKTGTDHDHCEFCGVKFSDTVLDALTQGYSTEDDYRWICQECFTYFKFTFNFAIAATSNRL